MYSHELVLFFKGMIFNYSKSPFKLSLWAKRSSNIVRIVLLESDKFEKNFYKIVLKTTILPF